MHSHKPKLKQVNKPFKGSKKSIPGRIVKHKHVALSAAATATKKKKDRLLASKQQRDKRKADALLKRRLGSRSTLVPPKVVMILPFKKGICPLAFKKAVLDITLENSDAYDEANDTVSRNSSTEFSLTTLQLPSWALSTTTGEGKKQKITLIDVNPYIYETDGNSNGEEDLVSKAGINAVLDVAKGANILVCLLPSSCSLSEPPFDSFGYEVLSALKLQGLPTPIGVMIGDADYLTLPLTKQRDRKNLVQRYFESELGSDAKFFNVSAPDDIKPVLRGMGNVTPKDFYWRANRGYLIADKVEFNMTSNVPSISKPSLILEGYARGVGFTVKHPVHITGIGDFILDSISVIPSKTDKKKKKDKEETVDHGNAFEEHTLPQVAEQLTPEMEKELEDEWRQLNPYDPLAGDQTWPTDEELKHAAKQNKSLKTGRINAPNTHNNDGEETIQSIWLKGIEETDGEEDGSDMCSEEDHMEEDVCVKNPADDDDDVMSKDNTSTYSDDNEVTTGHNELEHDKTFLEGSSAEDMNRNKKKLQFDLLERSREDLEYPDEVDTPVNQLARLRFARYRGLRSFKSSAWDPFEDLPAEYSRIFEFDAFRASMKYARKQYSEDCLILGHDKQKETITGHYVRLVLRLAPDIPTEMNKIEALRHYLSPSTSSLDISPSTVSKNHQNGRPPLIVSSIFSFERKVTVTHFRITSRDNSQESIPSKAEMEFHCGFRKFPARPIYSSAPVSSLSSVSENNNTIGKSKYERFLHPHVTTTTSLFCQAIAPPAPVLVFQTKKNDNTIEQLNKEKTRLIGWGSLLNSDPRRLVIKRIVLTGYPFRVHKKKAVIRYMFFNPEDIRWFKPVELHSKKGLRGHIKEPLGTHGYMKCLFNQTVDQSDTICMYLYKRVYPKWYPPTWGGAENDSPTTCI